MSQLNVNTIAPQSGSSINFSGSLTGTSYTGSFGYITADNVVLTGDLTANRYIVSSSITNVIIATNSGSTNFGDSLDDTHIYTGSLKLTGSISASKFSGSFFGDGGGLSNVFTGTTPSASISTRLTNLVTGGVTLTHVTASGNISASGTVYASKFESAGTSGETISFNDNLNITGNITGSGNLEIAGNISGSATTTGSFGRVEATTLGGTLTTAAQTNITSVGTIGTGVWNGTAVASAYLDADTAHLSTTQTFSGAKTFSSTLNTAAITATGNISGSSTSTGSFGTVSIAGSPLIKGSSKGLVFDGDTIYAEGGWDKSYEFHSGANNNVALFLVTNAGANKFEIAMNNTNAQFSNRDSGRMDFYNNSHNFMTATSDGNVGIGIRTAGVKLQVEGKTLINNDLEVTGSISGSSTSTGSFGLLMQGGSTLSSFAGADGTETTFSGSVASTGSFGQGFIANKLGIGTTAPSHGLEVAFGTDYQQLKLTDTDTDNTTQRIGIVAQPYNAEADPLGVLAVYDGSASSFLGIGGTSGDSDANCPMEIRFYTAATHDANSSAPHIKMIINKDGDVGIGTTTPGVALEVIGSISGSASSTGSFGVLNLAQYNAGKGATTGNTYFGNGPGNSATSATYNTFIGDRAGEDNTTADHNTYIGSAAGGNAQTAHDNVAIGSQAFIGVGNDDSNYNVAIGRESLQSSGPGSNNISIGYRASYTLSTSDTIMIGYKAGYYITTGAKTTIVGTEAGEFATTADNSTFIGYKSAQGITGAKLTGHNNTAVGNESGLLLQGAAADNTLMGGSVGDVITTGTKNTIIGAGADPSSATAENQIVIGSGSVGLGDNQTVIGNSSQTHVVFGGDALISGSATSTGSFGNLKQIGTNVAVGSNALSSIESSGINNTAVGTGAGQTLTTGDHNVLIGAQHDTDDPITTGNRNIIIGWNAKTSANNVTNEIFIGAGTTSHGYATHTPAGNGNHTTTIGTAESTDFYAGLTGHNTVHGGDWISTKTNGIVSGSLTSTGSFGMVMAGGSEITAGDSFSDGTATTISGSVASTGSFGQISLDGEGYMVSPRFRAKASGETGYSTFYSMYTAGVAGFGNYIYMSGNSMFQRSGNLLLIKYPVRLESGNHIEADDYITKHYPAAGAGLVDYIRYPENNVIRFSAGGGIIDMIATGISGSLTSTGSFGRVDAQDGFYDAGTKLSDYVFEPDYDLRSLDEVETFISQSKHLPGVPSQDDIDSWNNMSLGSKQTLFLEKIEELTLYTLQLHKRIKELEKP